VDSVDVLAIGAHPDDVEMTIGGTLAKLIDRGKRVAILDMTRGEMGTRGTPEQRDEEAAAAAQTLGAAARINLELPDGMIENTLEARALLIQQIRKLKPTVVFANYWEDLHPDHAATGRIVCDTMYPSGFAKYPVDGEPHRPKEYFFYLSHFVYEPSFIVDVTGYWEKKIESVKCYHSQLHNPTSDEKLTWISEPTFLTRLEARARHYGGMIRCEFGEPLITRRPVPMDDPVDHYGPFFN